MDAFIIWYIIGVFRQKDDFANYLFASLALFLILFVAVSHLPGFNMGHNKGEKTKMRHYTKMLHIAISAFHKDFNRYPAEIKELDGQNERQKIYFEGADALVEKYDIFYAVDEDNDGYIETDKGRLKESIAVWLYLDRSTLISSWD